MTELVDDVQEITLRDVVHGPIGYHDQQHSQKGACSGLDVVELQDLPDLVSGLLDVGGGDGGVTHGR